MQLRNALLRGDLGEARTRNSTFSAEYEICTHIFFGFTIKLIQRKGGDLYLFVDETKYKMVTLADPATASGTWEAPILLLDESAIYKAH